MKCSLMIWGVMASLSGTAFAQQSTQPDAGSLRQQIEGNRSIPLPQRLLPDNATNVKPLAQPLQGPALPIQRFRFSGKTVTLSSSYGGADAGNYTITDQLTTMASINAKVVSLSASKSYDGANSLTGVVKIDGLVGNESLGYKDATANDVHVATAGKYIKQIVLTDGSNGGLASNYVLPVLNADNAPVTISKVQLSVKANDASKTQDGSAYTGGNGLSFAGFVNGESATVLEGSLAWGGSSQGATSAGTYVISPKGLASGDYTITYVDGQLVIASPPPVVVVPSIQLPGSTPPASANPAGGAGSPIVPASLPVETGSSGSSTASSGSTSTSGAISTTSTSGSGTTTSASTVSNSGSTSTTSTGIAGSAGGANFSGASATGITGGSGSSNVVSLNVVRVATASQSGMAMVFVPNNVVAAQERFSFAVPKEVLTGLTATTPARLSLANGQPLPSWLRFDVTNDRIEIDAVPPQGLPLQVQLNVGGRVSIIYIADVEK